MMITAAATEEPIVYGVVWNIRAWAWLFRTWNFF